MASFGKGKMTERERKSMSRAALLLLGAAVIRFLASPGAPDPPLEDRPSITDSLLAAGDSVAQEKARRSRPLDPGEKIDPNTASEEELDRLPRVGASIARRIVEDREANGPYVSVADLARVPGLGARSVERLSPHLALPPAHPTLLPSRSARASGLSRSSPSPSARASTPVGPTPGPRVVPTPGPPGAPVDLNRATARELQELPGIGPALAERIVAFRTERGPFAKPEELMEVSGIGAKTYARLAPLVTARR